MSNVPNATLLSGRSLFVPSDLGKLSVIHDGHEFSVIDSKGLVSAIQRADLSKELRGISNESLMKILESGQLSLKKFGEDYSLSYNGQLRGGGLFAAIAVYAATTIAGGAMIVVGTITAPIGGVVLIAAGTATVTAAPTTFLVTLPTPTP